EGADRGAQSRPRADRGHHQRGQVWQRDSAVDIPGSRGRADRRRAGFARQRGRGRYAALTVVLDKRSAEMGDALSSSLRAQRSNPESSRGDSLDRFATLAMTKRRRNSSISTSPRTLVTPRRLVDIAALQQIIQSADAVPAIAVGLQHDAVLAAFVGVAVVFCEQIYEVLAG